jgi:hypothetical protein
MQQNEQSANKSQLQSNLKLNKICNKQRATTGRLHVCSYGIGCVRWTSQARANAAWIEGDINNIAKPA